MNTRYCYSCGSKILLSHQFCHACGTRLDFSFIGNEPEPQYENAIPSSPSIKKDLDYIDLFNRIEKTLKKESCFSDEEFEINWGEFKKYHYSNYSDNDIYWIFVKVVFYSGMKAATVTSKLPHIKKYLADYLKVKDYNEADIERMFKDPNIIKYKEKIQACINNAKRFHGIIDKYGNFKNYIESFGDPTEDSVIEKFRAALMEFDFIGPTTSYHVMLDLGLNVWKPDRVICRILERLGLIDDRNNRGQAVLIGKDFAKNIGLPIRYIDIIMVKYGQQGQEDGFGLKDGICLEKNPRCHVCGITDYCIAKVQTI